MLLVRCIHVYESILLFILNIGRKPLNAYSCKAYSKIESKTIKHLLKKNKLAPKTILLENMQRKDYEPDELHVPGWGGQPPWNPEVFFFASERAWGEVWENLWVHMLGPLNTPIQSEAVCEVSKLKSDSDPSLHLTLEPRGFLAHELG